MLYVKSGIVLPDFDIKKGYLILLFDDDLRLYCKVTIILLVIITDKDSFLLILILCQY